jgi:hypothetical protein
MSIPIIFFLMLNEKAIISVAAKGRWSRKIRLKIADLEQILDLLQDKNRGLFGSVPFLKATQWFNENLEVNYYMASLVYYRSSNNNSNLYFNRNNSRKGVCTERLYYVDF